MLTSTLLEKLKHLCEAQTRQAIHADPKRYAVDNGILSPNSDTEVRVVQNTKDTFYVAIAFESDHAVLGMDQLGEIQAAGLWSGFLLTHLAGTFSCPSKPS